MFISKHTTEASAKRNKNMIGYLYRHKLFSKQGLDEINQFVLMYLVLFKYIGGSGYFSIKGFFPSVRDCSNNKLLSLLEPVLPETLITVRLL